MNNLNLLLLQNEVNILNSIITYAKKDGYLQYIPKVEKKIGLSLDNISKLVESVKEIPNFCDFNTVMSSYFNASGIQDMEIPTIDIPLICIKYYRRSYLEFINSCDFSCDVKNFYADFFLRLFDALEIYLSKAWTKQCSPPILSEKTTGNNINYQLIVENSSNPIIVINFNGSINDMNKAARKLFYELTDNYFFQGEVADALPWLTFHYNEFVRSSNTSFNYEQYFNTKKGPRYFDVKLNKTKALDSKRNEINVIMTNISGYKKMSKELSESKLRYQSLFKNMFEFCTYNKIILDVNNNPIDFTILDINDSLIKDLGLRRDDIIGSIGSEIFSFLSVTDFDWLNHFGRAAVNGENIRIKELHLKSINKWYSISIYSSEEDYFAFVYSDISEKKQAEESVIKLAYYDVLTGLPNSKKLDDKIKHAIKEATSNDKFAVMFIDITNFKKINNTLGHKIGDAMLKQLAERLLLITSSTDTVARHGGDKFVILKNNVRDLYEVSSFAEKITHSFNPPFTFNNHEFFIEANIGISMFPEDADNMHTLKRNADTAMFVARTSPDTRYVFHKKDMNDRALKNLLMEADLRKALNKNQLSLHYQPLVNIETGDIIAFEALLRWKHEETGMISPVEFIPIAEENGLIIPIGDWVIQTAAKQCKEWHQKGYGDIYVAVNVSIAQLQQRGFIDRLTEILEEVDLDPQYLKVEITESVYMENIDSILSTLSALKDMGITLSLDDFGTGYSSLNYLNRLPINTLKIDKSFIKNMDSNKEYAILTRAIIKMAHSLNLDVVAEGVETIEELNLLKEHKCDKIQGFLFSQPLCSETVNDILYLKKNLYTKEAL